MVDRDARIEAVFRKSLNTNREKIGSFFAKGLLAVELARREVTSTGKL